MSEFHDKFTQNPEFSNWYEWATPKPIFRASRIKYEINVYGSAVIDDDDHNDVIPVVAFCENDNGFGEYHEKAWEFIVSNSLAIERSLRRKLWPKCLENYQACLADMALDDPDWQTMKDAEQWDDERSLDSQIELTEIGLIDDGFDDVGFSIFEFAVGWDEEHGLSILMHKAHVLAASSGADFTNRGPELIPHAKYIQEYDFTDGDLRIEG